MAEINSINSAQNISSNQSLQMLASQSVLAQKKAAEESKKTEKKQKSSFKTVFEKARETHDLVSEGLPAEIAGMETEEAVNFLKDAMDSAGEELKSFQSAENMEKFRKKVSQFMKYIVKTNYNFVRTRPEKRLRNGKIIRPFYQIEIIDKKLNQLASEMLFTHERNLNLLARVEEIQGLILDLLVE